RVSQNQVGQNFTFVLTDIDSKQRFGFCRLTQGCRVCICLLSYLPWFEIYYKLLNTLADYLTKQQENDLNDLLNSLYELPVPKPFTPVNLSVVGIHLNLTEYFVAVDINNMLQLYASMLHERRIIITSRKLSTLTACVHGAAALLFPMYWQHIFIPVLPPHLLDYCCAPMPYFVGVHYSLLERVRSRSLEDVVILNVDTNTLETPFDDLHNLPSDVVSILKGKLKKQSTATGSGVAGAFLRAQAALFGSYRDALRYKPGEPITFCEESFANHRSSTMKNFLSMAVNLQLFKQFIDGRLAKLNAGRGFTDVFEEEITEGGFCGSEYHAPSHLSGTVCSACQHTHTYTTLFRGTQTDTCLPHRNRQEGCFTWSVISSEDSGEVRSYTEDSDDSDSFYPDIDPSPSSQMNLLEEILDSLTTTTMDQGKLSAAKSLDFFRSLDDLDFKPSPCSDSTAADDSSFDGGADHGGWNMGQDDSAVHGKHLPPSPRRQPNKSSLKRSKNLAAFSAVTRCSASPPSNDANGTKSDPPPLFSSKSRPDSHLLMPSGRPPGDHRLSYSPLLPHKVTPLSPPASQPDSSPELTSRSRTISDPQGNSEPSQTQNQTGSTGILRRKVMSKEMVKNYHERSIRRQRGGNHESQASPMKSSQVQVPWKKEEEERKEEKEAPKDKLLGFGLCLGQCEGSETAGGPDPGLLEEIESMCCLSSSLHSSLHLSQVHCSNSHQGKATEKS
uniref:DENN/MADD domain containing 1B n=1 Tax=Xiphophorus couchianus TaxID=32473 RepID=A0A3B5LCQ9_9TELE